MGGTLVASMKAAGHVDLVVIEKDADQAERLAAAHGVQVGDDIALVAGASVVLIGVKPQDVPKILPALAEHLDPDAVVVSLAAGVRTATFEEGLGDKVAVVRAMPNTPALIGAGMFGVSPGSHVASEQLDHVVELLSTSGRVVVVDESQQDAVTAVSGSGPAYVYYLAEQMIEAGVAEGLDRQVARTLAVQTLLGTSQLLAESEDEPAELRRRVTSPNGTTWAATHSFDESGVAEGLLRGIRAAAARSAELG